MKCICINGIDGLEEYEELLLSIGINPIFIKKSGKIYTYEILYDRKKSDRVSIYTDTNLIVRISEYEFNMLFMDLIEYRKNRVKELLYDKIYLY